MARNDKACCGNCDFFFEIPACDHHIFRNIIGDIDECGICRKRAPHGDPMFVMNRLEQINSVLIFQFPVVFRDIVCGDHPNFYDSSE